MIPRTASDRSEGEAAASAGYAWWVVIALTAVYTLSFVDRTILGLLVPSIKRDLGVSARIILLPFGSLPRSEGKTRRVIRKDRP